MPTSKDILNEAKKDLDKNATAEKALKDIVDTGTTDLADFARAKQVLRTSINSMNKMAELLESRLKELIRDLEQLEKQEPVMKAPADARVYAALVQAFKDEMKQSRNYQLKIDALAKKAEDYIR
jgi:hypothetical protein